MLKRGVTLVERDLLRNPLTEGELKYLFRDLDPRDFLNPRHPLYRRRKMKESPPSRTEALRLMAGDPNLIRRPLVVRGNRAVAGFDEMGLLRLLR